MYCKLPIFVGEICLYSEFTANQKDPCLHYIHIFSIRRLPDLRSLDPNIPSLILTGDNMLLLNFYYLGNVANLILMFLILR